MDSLIDPREDELLLWAGAVQVGVGETQSPGPVFLLDQDWVCQPLGVFDWPNEACSKYTLHLLGDCSVELFIEGPQRLLDMSRFGVGIEFVLSELPRDTRHVGRFPCEDV